MIIATHNGPFHADDVLAVALLRLLVDNEAKVIRTRDESTIAEADVVVDVGGTFNPAAGRFDHHQFRSTAERVRSKWLPGVPLSSAGMVLEDLVRTDHLTEEEGERLYRSLLAEVDLLDNGEAESMGAGLPIGGNLTRVISRFNPVWDAEDKDFDGRFEAAVAWAIPLIGMALESVRADIRALRLVEGGVKEMDGLGIVQLPVPVPSARDLVLDVEGGENASLLVHPSAFGGWMVMTIPPSREDAFSQRVPLPASWAGLRGAELNSVLASAGIDEGILAKGTAEVPSAVFCHTGRFCGGHGTGEAATQMAIAAIAAQDS